MTDMKQSYVLIDGVWTPFGSAAGEAGPGVPAGGTTDQVLTKNSATDFDTAWAPPGEPAGAVAAHEAALDPHPIYLTAVEGDAAYAAIDHTHGPSGSWPFEWKTNTAATDPAHGFIKADQSAATAYTNIYMSVYDKNNQAVLALNDMSVDDEFYLYEAGQISTWNKYRVTAPVTLWGSPPEWATIPAVFVESGPALFTPGGNTQVLFTLVGGGAGVTGGVAILSGTATPDAGTGATGDYYLDTDDRILYGPKVAGGTIWGPNQSAYTTQTHAEEVNLGDFSMGNDFQFAVAGRITGVRMNIGYDTPYSLSVWSSSGVLLGSCNLTPGTSSPWRSQTLATPIAVAAGQTVRIALNVPNAHTGPLRRGPNPASNIVNGDVTMLKQGYYIALAGSPTGLYPTTTTASTYFVDVIFQAAGAVVEWPVALKSVPPGGTTSQVLAKTAATDYAANWATAAAAGSTILSGTATPIGATGAVGDYYLDTDDNILYGPKVTASGGYYPAESVFTTQTPDSTGNISGSYGNDVTFAQAGRITAVRYNRNAGATATSVQFKIWLGPAPGTVLATASTSGDAGAGWMTATLSTPLNVTAGQTLRVTMHLPTTNLSNRIGANTGPIANGSLTMGTATFGGSVDVYPESPFGTRLYFIDVVFEPGSPPVDPWPVALTSASGNESTILSGTATPTAGIGNGGGYYLDTDDRVLYGPKALSEFGSPQSVFTSQTPPYIGDWMGEFANRIQVAKAGRITGVRYWRGPGAIASSHVLSLWPDSAGAKLATVTTSGETGTGWVTGTFVTPVGVTAGQFVRAAITVTSTTPSSVPVDQGTSAPITNGDVSISGLPKTKWNSPGVFPDGEDLGPARLWVDIIFEATEQPWPVALKSVPPGGTTSQVLAKSSATDYNANWATAAVAGSTILSGTATPTVDTGATGDYYLDTDDSTLYGPRNSLNYGAAQSVWTSQVPAGAEGLGGWSLASNFTFAKAGRITALRFYKHSTGLINNHALYAWNTTNQAQLGSTTTSGESGAGWKTAVLASPIAIAAAQQVRVSVHFAGSENMATYVPTTNIVNSDITMSGTFGGSPGAVYPNSAPPSAYFYMLDVVFEPAPEAVVWPVAIEGGATILTGIAAPTTVTGADGYYYLDADDRILYGPRTSSAYGVDESVWTGSSFSSTTTAMSEVGVDLKFLAAGQITAIKFYRASSNAQSSRTLKVWNTTTQALLGSGITTETPYTSGWLTVPIAPVINVTANQTVRLSMDHSVNHDVAYANPGPGTKGNLQMPNGTFSNNTLGQYPGTQASPSSCYVLDVVFNTVGSGPVTWPVALKSVPPGGTTSQVLAKTSATDYAAGWTAPSDPAAAITAHEAAANPHPVYLTQTEADALYGGGGLQTRATASVTTTSLAAGAGESTTVTLAPSYRLMQLTTNRPARVRLYTTAAKRDADISRPIGTDPYGNHGVIFDFFAPNTSVMDLSPVVDGFDGDAPPDGTISARIENMDTVAGTVEATFVWIKMET